MTTAANAENLKQCKSILFLIVEQTLALTQSTNFVREV